MKKLLIFIAILMAAAVLTSCVPTDRQDIRPYCQEQYELLLEDVPDFPPAFINACVASLQSGNATAFMSLCGDEVFRKYLEAQNPGLTLSTRQECIQFIKNSGSE